MHKENAPTNESVIKSKHPNDSKVNEQKPMDTRLELDYMKNGSTIRNRLSAQQEKFFWYMNECGQKGTNVYEATYTGKCLRPSQTVDVLRDKFDDDFIITEEEINEFTGRPQARYTLSPNIRVVSKGGKKC